MREFNIVRVHELTKDTKKLCKKFDAQYAICIVVKETSMAWEQWSPDSMQPAAMQYIMAQLGQQIEGLSDDSRHQLRGPGAIAEQN